MKQLTGFMKGINIGGWISQCGDHHNDEHYSTFITKEDYKVMASYGIDHVRLPIDYNVVQNDDGTLKEERFKILDEAFSWAKEYGLNVVLDLHKTCGFVFDDEKYCDFFTDEKLQDQFVFLWEEFARRYGSLGFVAFELLNEITAREMAEPWNRIVARTIPAIRKIAPEVKIIVGGIFNSSIYGLTLLDKPYDENTVYTFHCYNPIAFTHQGAGWLSNMPADYRISYPQKASMLLDESHKFFGNDFDGEFEAFGDEVIDDKYFVKMFSVAMDIADKYDTALYCGEYGVIDKAEAADTLKWYKDIHKALDDNKIARCAWTYKAMDFGVTQDAVAPVYNELIALLGK